MPQLNVVKATLHSQFSWQTFTHYRFAATDTYAPLLVSEFQQASSVSPIAFVKDENAYSPVLMMGIQEGSNLLVSVNGKWLGSYVPAYYRSHPFAIAKDQNKKLLLSFHSDSEFVIDHYAENSGATPFFVDGELSDELKAVKEFLHAIEISRLKGIEFCAKCEELGLFSPWDLQVNTGKERINLKGLHCIDEAKLKALPAEQIKSLLESGTLSTIYNHLGSLHLTKHLVILKQKHEISAAYSESTPPSQELLTSTKDSELIDLDW